MLIGALIGLSRLCLMVFDPGSHFDPVTQKLITDPSLHTGIFAILKINWLHFCILLFFFTMALMVVISMFTPKATEQQLQGITYFSQSPDQIKETRESWSMIDVITTLIVVGICIAFYLYFW